MYIPYIKHNLNIKRRNAHVHREFPRRFESTNLSRDNLSRAIERMTGQRRKTGGCPARNIPWYDWGRFGTTWPKYLYDLTMFSHLSAQRPEDGSWPGSAPSETWFVVRFIGNILKFQLRVRHYVLCNVCWEISEFCLQTQIRSRILRARMHQMCHFRKRATSVPAEGPAYGLDFARRCEFPLRALQAQRWRVRGSRTFGWYLRTGNLQLIEISKWIGNIYIYIYILVLYVFVSLSWLNYVYV